MKIFVFWVGNRTVYLDGKSLDKTTPEGIPNIEEYHIKKAEKILEEFEKYKDRLSMPLISPVLSKEFGFDREVDEIILIGTNQDDERYHFKDTLPLAKVASKLLIFSGCRYVKVIEFRGNPTSIKDLTSFYLKKLNFLFKVGKKDKLIFCESGGTDQMTYSFLTVFSENISSVIKVLPDGTVEDITDEIYSLFLNPALIKQAIVLAKNYDFYASLSVLENIKHGQSSKLDNFKSLISYLNHRYLFQLSKALEIAEKNLSEDYKYDPKDGGFMFVEVIESAIIEFEKRRLNDFLARISRFDEFFLHSFLRSLKDRGYLGKAVELYRNHVRGKKYFEEVEGLNGENYEILEKKIDEWNKVQSLALFLFLYALYEENGDAFWNLLKSSNDIDFKKDLKRFLLFGKYLMVINGRGRNFEVVVDHNLIQLRNKSLVGHAFYEITEERVNSAIVSAINKLKFFDLIDNPGSDVSTSFLEGLSKMLRNKFRVKCKTIREIVADKVSTFDDDKRVLYNL
ncbi:MAG: hypothetical protein ACTSUR_08765 [Candidatus Heimdallarchaeaceae archaeon]